MRRPHGGILALLAAALASILLLAGSFLPLFMGTVWGPLWGVEWWSAEGSRSFGRVGPWCGVSEWPLLLATPISAVFVLFLFSLIMARVLLSVRGQRR